MSETAGSAAAGAGTSAPDAAERIAQPVADAQPAVAEPPAAKPRLRRTVSWADAQPDKSLGLVAVREFEPR
jgi:hypothetical protein